MSPVLTQHVSQPITLDEQTQKMKRHLLQDIRRSAYVYRVDCGGCNACEIEIFAAITPVFDAERFGIKVVSSPRHADILLFTGAVTRAMRMPALRAYESAPDHKICVSYGACGAGGGFSTISTVRRVPLFCPERSEPLLFRAELLRSVPERRVCTGEPAGNQPFRPLRSSFPQPPAQRLSRSPSLR